MLKTKLLVTSIMAIVLTGCCLIDYTKTIEKVAEPMLKELQQFYKEHQRYPTIKERDVMLQRSGCKMEGDVCFFEGEELVIIESGREYDGDYRISIGLFKDRKSSKKDILASCGFSIYEDGGSGIVVCAKTPCIEIRQ